MFMYPPKHKKTGILLTALQSETPLS